MISRSMHVFCVLSTAYQDEYRFDGLLILAVQLFGKQSVQFSLYADITMGSPIQQPGQ